MGEWMVINLLLYNLLSSNNNVKVVSFDPAIFLRLLDFKQSL